MEQARILSVTVAPGDRAAVLEVVDATAAELVGCPGFGGLLCLEHGGTRPRITVVSVWDATTMAATAPDHDALRRRLAAVTDLGATTGTEDVLRLVPGRVDGGERLRRLLEPRGPAGAGARLSERQAHP
ncbi:MAG TPA: hypothetical protein VMB72_02415 [Acidimicrobiales bacterium]|nr:hypothetical protein [Acidimicrobiales bacterium]